MLNRAPRGSFYEDEYNSDSSSGYTEGSVKESGDVMSGFILPAFWDNDILMEPLMGPFRLRSLDPDAYDLKLIFWQDMIGAFCMHKRNACFNKLELQLVFKRKNRIPYGFDTVLEEMLNTKQIRFRNEYEFDPCNTWKGWAVNVFIKKPMQWAISKIPLVGEDSGDGAKIEFIHLDVMRKFCSELETYLEQHSGKLLNFENVLNQFKDQLRLTEEVIILCLETLFHKRVIGLEYLLEKNIRRIHFVKIPGKLDPVVEITETNRAVYNLEMTQRSLMGQLESIENEILMNEEKARQYVKDGKRQLAKTYLRKKLLLERNHEKRSIALHNVESLLCSVNEAQSNGEILGAYKIGSKALQNMLNAAGLKYENVDEVISEIRDSIDTHNELNETMANINVMDSIVDGKLDDDALEQELRDIVGETSKINSLDSKSRENDVHTLNRNASDVSSQKDNINNNNIAVKQIEINDAELLAMLDELEVEQNSPGKSTQNSHSRICTDE